MEQMLGIVKVAAMMVGMLAFLIVGGIVAFVIFVNRGREEGE